MISAQMRRASLLITVFGMLVIQKLGKRSSSARKVSANSAASLVSSASTGQFIWSATTLLLWRMTEPIE
jgi:hypothetical protein